MTPRVYWFCFSMAWVSVYMIEEIKDMTVFRKYTQEQQCPHDTTLAELEPCGSLQCFTKCLQLASCSHMRFNSKALNCRLCRISKNVPDGKPKDSQSDEDWICWKKTSSVPCTERQQHCRCVQSRGGETKCVQNDLQGKLQRKGRMSTRRNTQVLNITPEDLKDNWITKEFQRRPAYSIQSLTWSPSFANDFYSLSQNGIKSVIELFRLKGNSLMKQAKWANIFIGKERVNWAIIDTGMCWTNDDMSCIHVFGKLPSLSTFVVYLHSYREDKISHLLELERKVEIRKHLRSIATCIFACIGDVEMAIFVRSAGSSVTNKFLLQDVGGKVTMDEMKAVQGLEKPDNMKWNSDGTYLFAMSSQKLYFIRYYNDEEQVTTEVQHEWRGPFAPVWANTCILVYDNNFLREAARTRLLRL